MRIACVPRFGFVLLSLAFTSAALAESVRLSAPIPDTIVELRLELTATEVEVGQVVPLTVTGVEEDGDTRDLTRSGSLSFMIGPPNHLLRDEQTKLLTAAQAGHVFVLVRYTGNYDLNVEPSASFELLVGLSQDRDADGMTDAFETIHGFDPADPADSVFDADRDALLNRDEQTHGTDPHNPDTDGDGRNDSIEIFEGTNPLEADPSSEEPPPQDTTLDASCIVNILNRTARVDAAGVWVLPNVPSAFGQVRARATCFDAGQSRSGQSDYFTVPPNGVVRVADLSFATRRPAAERLELATPTLRLDAASPIAQLRTIAIYSDGSTADVTASSAGTTYSVSNPVVIAVDSEGRATALSSGVVLVAAANEGASGVLRLEAVLSADSDGDGIPDDVELALGLDPNDGVDAIEDPDHDALATGEELNLGTHPRNPDTDTDTLLDGEEGTYGTHPLLFDTDGDGLSDGLEIRTGSDPLDPASYNLAAALAGFTATPASFDLVYNTLLGEASVQLGFMGELIDGNTLDLTSTARGTSYSSSDLTVCSFGIEPGRVFAGNDGTCTITIANSGFSAEVAGTVRVFSPRPLGFVSLPGLAHDVEVVGDLAYVAAGAAGIVVVDVSDRSAPFVVATFDTPGNCQALRVEGSIAYVADGTNLRILDLANPLAPVLLGTLALTGDVQALALRAGTAYVAAGTAGFHVVDVRVPAAPLRLATIDTPGTVRGVDVATEAEILLIADGASGLRLYDLSGPALPLLSTVATGDAWGVAARGSAAFVADRVSSLVAVDFTNPAAPARGAAVPPATGGLLEDVALSGPFALGADVFFVNGVPILDVSSLRQPIPRAIVDFSGFRADAGTGIAVDNRYLYLTAQQSGFSRLYVGQYLLEQDLAGVPPTVAITAPVDGEQVASRTTVSVSVEASDDVAVAVVRLRLDGVEVATDTVAPYVFELRVPGTATTLELSAVAEDFGGNTKSTPPIQLQVVPFADTTPPTLAITDPGDGSPVLPGTTVVLRYEARDDHALEGYRLSVAGQEADGASLLDALAVMREVSYTVPPGTAPGTVLEVLAEARDFGGNVTTESIDLVVPVGTTLSGNQVLDSRYTGQSLILAAGTFTAVEPLALANLTVLAGARVTAPLETPLRLTVADALRVQSGGSLDVSGLGYEGGSPTHPAGFAAEGYQGAQPDAGGSHGGTGVVWRGPGPAGEVYDSVYTPRLPGGGGSRNPSNTRTGTRGGGVIDVEAGTVVLEGQILARAEPSSFNADRPGGAGGTIVIRTETLSGLGTLDASGASTAADNVSTHHVGAGGGGRIVLDVDALVGFDPTAQTRAWGGSRTQNATVLGYAAPGTVLVVAGTGPGRLIVDNGEEANGTDRVGPATELPRLGGEYRFDVLELRHGAGLLAHDPLLVGTVLVDGAARLPAVLVADDLTLLAGSIVTVASGSTLDLIVSGTLTIESTARLDLTGRGYAGGSSAHPDGFASEGVAPSSPDAGGSHGGRGVVWNGPGPAGEVYDSVYAPSLPGGGGAANEGNLRSGTAGGGAIRLEVDTLVLEGEIRANAEASPFNSDRPGGAGGSVWVRAATVRGAGSINASGASTAADNVTNHHVGAGGGGRVALDVDLLDGFDPAVQVRTWGGARQQNNTMFGWAAPGTVLVVEGEGEGRLIVDNGTGRGAGITPLPALGAWPILDTEEEGDDLWVETTAAFLPSWLGAWPVLRDGAGGSLGSFRVGEIDALGRVRLLGARGVAGAVAIEGAYRFETILTPNGTVVTASDPVVVTNP